MINIIVIKIMRLSLCVVRYHVVCRLAKEDEMVERSKKKKKGMKSRK